MAVRRANQLTWAIGLGYLLGRRRKLRTAMMLGAAAAASRFVRLGGSASSAVEPRGAAGGLVSKLGVAGQAAARTALETPFYRLSQRLDEVAEAVRGASTERR
ncbi:MAG TPA: hypothetical protein VHN18_04340 [Micromonosporaceae bacterium]|nr:hypothetical protein [Micromonosporaceae bacterium]